MSMQVRVLDGQRLPNQWTDQELPYALDCGVSVSAAWACMSELSAPVWVPKTWHDLLNESWA